MIAPAFGFTAMEAADAAPPAADLYERVAAVQREAAATEASIGHARAAVDELQAHITAEEEVQRLEAARLRELVEAGSGLGPGDADSDDGGDALWAAEMAGARALLAQQQAAAAVERDLLAAELDAIPCLGGADADGAHGHSGCGGGGELSAGAPLALVSSPSMWPGGAASFSAALLSLMSKLTAREGAAAAMGSARASTSDPSPAAPTTPPAAALSHVTTPATVESPEPRDGPRKRLRISFEADADLEAVTAVTATNLNRRSPRWRREPQAVDRGAGFVAPAAEGEAAAVVKSMTADGPRPAGLSVGSAVGPTATVADRAVLRVEIPAMRLRRSGAGERGAADDRRQLRGQKVVWRLGTPRPPEAHDAAGLPG